MMYSSFDATINAHAIVQSIMDYRFSNSGFRVNLMKRIKKHFKELPGVVEDPFQRTLLEY